MFCDFGIMLGGLVGVSAAVLHKARRVAQVDIHDVMIFALLGLGFAIIFLALVVGKREDV